MYVQVEWLYLKKTKSACEIRFLLIQLLKHSPGSMVHPTFMILVPGYNFQCLHVKHMVCALSDGAVKMTKSLCAQAWGQVTF